MPKIVKEQNDLSTISLTKEAVMKIKALMKTKGGINIFLRFVDIAGHCGGGFGYKLDFSFAPNPEDAIFHSHGIEVHIPKGSLKRLLGSVIHYEKNSPNKLFEGLLKTGFTITNPNAKGLCSCGCQKGYKF